MNRYQRRRGEFRKFIEGMGRKWECADCGATDKPLAAFSNSNPPPASEIARLASFGIQYDDVAAANSPLLCVKCRHARKRVAKRLAAVGVIMGGE